MPQAHGASTQLVSPAEMEIAGGEKGTQSAKAAIAAPDEQSMTGKGDLKQRDKQSLDYVLKSGLAGGLAACTAKTVVGPLDRVKILFQTSSPQFEKYTGSWFGVVRAVRDINRQDGLRGLFQGHSATLLRIFPYGAIKFLAYEQVRSVIIPSAAEETPLRRFLSGSLAGMTSVFITYPLEVIRVRLAFQTKREGKPSLRAICQSIYNEHPATKPATSATAVLKAVKPSSGLINFYRGFFPTLMGMLPYAGMSFLTHDTARDWLRVPALAKYTMTTSPKGRDAPPVLKYWAELISGGVAGLVAQTSAYPLEIIRRRMQVGGAVGDGHRLGMGETTLAILREKGWRGFWVGLGIGYIKVVPMVAVSFFVYERSKIILGV